ncbi:hypothetical protein ACJJIF_12070 [Microbulbifer sp. SSSA002]|uniref:hypothetical protein n=1 Tax=unclassified Microbulbifer TaxID=2619833 RepID=UPI00403A3178
MINIGDTKISFSDIVKGSIDCSGTIRIERENCSVSGSFIYSKNNSPLDSLLSLSSVDEVSWKSDCENLIVTKCRENEEYVFNVNLCIDSIDKDEYWEVKVVTAPVQKISVNNDAIKLTFK